MLIVKNTNSSISVNLRKNKAGYIATKVECGWAGAVRKKSNSSIWAGELKNAKDAEKANKDQPTNRRTNQHSGL